MFNREHKKKFLDDISSLIDYMIFSSTYLSIAGIMMCYISSEFHGLPFNPITGIIMFLIIFSVYNINRKTDVIEDAINNNIRTSFIEKNGKFLFNASIVAYLITFVFAAIYGINSLLISSIPLLSGILYSFPIAPKNYRIRRLKEIPLIKNLIIGLAWSIPPTFLPLIIWGLTFWIYNSQFFI